MNGDVPQWSRNENDAETIVSLTCGGEFSAVFNNHLEKWLVLYGCDVPRGIQFRTADSPWGPYSDTEVVFDPGTDGGYCVFMHTDWNFNVCDSIHDHGREYEWGGEYGPYMFNNLSSINDSLVTIYYTLSTWNPYTVVLMKSILVKPDLDTPTRAENRDINSDITVFPNPCNRRINIKGDFTEWKVYSISGTLMQSGYQNIINISSCKAGVYFIQVDGTVFKVFKE